MRGGLQWLSAALASAVMACGSAPRTSSPATVNGGAGGEGGAPVQGPLTWAALPGDGAPSPRYEHTAVWTGSAMIVWGGAVKEMPGVTSSGALYDPVSKAWRPMSTDGAPAPREGHSAVWTGERMIVWGGYGEADYVADGAAYDPASDSWAPIATAGQPQGRSRHTATWADGKMVIWGGAKGGAVTGDGGIYDPASDTWTPVSASGAPSQRYNHTTIWTGSELVFWGGYDFFDWLNDGRSFDPAANAWNGATSAEEAPWRRDQHTAVWTGTRMLVWGGWTGGPYENRGGLLDLAAGGWTATSTTLAPSGRAENIGVWTGKELVVWGGCTGDVCGTVLGDGGRFTPDDAGGRWTPVEEQPALAARRAATAVFTGHEVVVFGGRDAANHLLGTGAEAEL